MKYLVSIFLLLLIASQSHFAQSSASLCAYEAAGEVESCIALNNEGVIDAYAFKGCMQPVNAFRKTSERDECPERRIDGNFGNNVSPASNDEPGKGETVPAVVTELTASKDAAGLGIIGLKKICWLPFRRAGYC